MSERPPVGPSRAVAAPEAGVDAAYQAVVDSLKGESRVILAMFGGDRQLFNKFMAVTFSALANNSDTLRDASVVSIVQAIKDAASLGLEPTGLGGEGFINVYRGVAVFQPMWRGHLKRIRNSGKVLDVDCQLVYANDEFRLTLGTNPGIVHVPALQPKDAEAAKGNWRGTITDVYAWALMPSGTYIIERMTTAEVDAVRDRYARGTDRADSPWRTAWGEMARKTVLNKLEKRLPGAAVDQLLLVENKANEQMEVLKVAAEKANSQIDEVRNLALAAVGQQRLEAGATTNADGQPEATGPTAQPDTPAGQDGASTAAESQPEGVDPEALAHAAYEAEQQRQRLERRGSR